MARLFLLLVWLAQLGLVLLLTDARWIEEQVATEAEQLVTHFGSHRAQHLSEQAQAIFDRYFITTAMVSKSYAMLLPDPTVPQHGMTEVAPWFFAWLRQRIDVAWLLTSHGILRVLLLCEWLPLTLMMIAVACVDGHVQRRIKRAEHALASADRYVLARRASLIALAFPAFYVVLPLVVSPLVVAAWGAYTAIIAMLLMAHAQHRI